MAKASRYDTVRLLKRLGAFEQGKRAAVVEVYAFPYEAYDLEIVDDDGKTKGLLDAVRPEEIEVIGSHGVTDVRVVTIRLEEEGSRASVIFSDGTQATVTAQDLHSLKRNGSRQPKSSAGPFQNRRAASRTRDPSRTQELNLTTHRDLIFVKIKRCMNLAAFLLAEANLALWSLTLSEFLYQWQAYVVILSAGTLVMILVAALVKSKAILYGHGVCVLIITCLGCLGFLSEYPPGRRAFLRDLDRVQSGMTAAQVDEIMKPYITGTGWPANPYGPGPVQGVGSPKVYRGGASPSGELTIEGSKVYRWTNDGDFDSDWGVVSFSRGVVSDVDFNPD